MFTDSFHLQSSNLIHLYSIGSMVTNHVRQRTELSEALSVASATDAHGSSIKEHQVSKRRKLSAILTDYREVHGHADIK